MPETLQTLAETYAQHYDFSLRCTAWKLLWDWRAAANIMQQVKAEAEARLHEYNPELSSLGGWLACMRDRLTFDRVQACGYLPPTREFDIAADLKDGYVSEDDAAAIRAERAELAQRIETLPITLREPMRLWLDREEIPESLGWYVRQGLTLLGQRRAAA